MLHSFSPRARLQAESGFSLVELIITMVVMGIVMGGLADIFISGQRASADATARVTSQQSVRVAFDRLEFDTRCAQTAALLSKVGSNGGGVHLNMQTTCAHASGDVTWCYSSGTLVRYVASTCSGTAQTYITSVTSATPFSCYSPVSGSTPQLKVTLTVNTTNRNSDKTVATDYITMRNAIATACS
jgi:prepilin-type N-terminal cleavage/methylation domain-containing protein